MTSVGRPKALLVLSDDEREQLTWWVRRAKSSQALALRSKIVLASAEGANNTDVAGKLGVAAHTVAKWRARFVAERLNGLVDEPRPGRPPLISVDQVEEVIVATLESTPVNATHWSRASMAKHSGLSKSTIGRIWRTFELKPHRVEGFKFSTDPLFVEKVYDVIGLYLNPPEAAVVYCVDEKSQIQALDRSGPVLPMMHIVCDNYATHKTSLVKNWLTYRPPQVPCSLHLDRVVLAQPGRTVVRLPHPATPPTQRPQEYPDPRTRHPNLGHRLEREPQTLHLDQNRRTDPRIPRTTNETNYRRRTRVVLHTKAFLDNVM